MLYEDCLNIVDMSSRLSGVIPSFAATKPRVKTLEVERPGEKSAPMPIIFGLLFEVHSGPADGVSSSQQGEGPDAGPLPPRVPPAFKLLTSCRIYVLHPFGFSSERLTFEEERQAGERTCGEVRERKIKKLVSLFEGLDPGGAHFPEHQGGQTDDQTLSSA